METRAPQLILRPPAAGEMEWIIRREGAIYKQEFGFDESFEALVARIVEDFEKKLRRQP